MKNWLKPSIVAGLLVTLVLCTSGKNDVTKFAIAENGKAKCVILRGAAPTESEKLAEKELLEHLAKITGATFEVFDEKSAPQGTPAVYLGWTELAKKEGLDFGKMEETEWLIRSDSEKIIIGGGRPQGRRQNLPCVANARRSSCRRGWRPRGWIRRHHPALVWQEVACRDHARRSLENSSLSIIQFLRRSANDNENSRSPCGRKR